MKWTSHLAQGWTRIAGAQQGINGLSILAQSQYFGQFYEKIAP